MHRRERKEPTNARVKSTDGEWLQHKTRGFGEGRTTAKQRARRRNHLRAIAKKLWDEGECNRCWDDGSPNALSRMCTCGRPIGHHSAVHPHGLGEGCQAFVPRSTS